MSLLLAFICGFAGGLALSIGRTRHRDRRFYQRGWSDALRQVDRARAMRATPRSHLREVPEVSP